MMKPRHDDVLAEITRLIRCHRSICITMHLSPDGDTLGAALGLWHGLKTLTPDVWVYSADPSPRVYHFLPGVESIRRVYKPASLIIAVDCADAHRTGLSAEEQATADAIIVIDHHSSNRGFGTVNWVDGQASSTSELIYQLLTYMHIPITPAIADALYTGLVTDTGRFCFSYTRPQALRIGADLLEHGAHFDQVCNLVFQRRTLAKTRLTGMTLSTLEVVLNGRACVMHVTLDMLRRCGATAEDTEAIINYGIEVEGMQVAVLLHEQEAGLYKVSLRAAGRADVAAVATALGGGGHVQAAGCTLKGDYDAVRRRVLDAVAEHGHLL